MVWGAPMAYGLGGSLIGLLLGIALGVLLGALLFRGGTVSTRLDMLITAQEGLRNDLGQRLQGIADGQMTSSHRHQEVLQDLSGRLEVIKNAGQTIGKLSDQVIDLQKILSNKQARGAFAEGRLEHMVQDMLPSGLYSFQATLGNGKRPDCLLHLPDPPGSVAVDSKFPLESWLRAQHADEQDQPAHWKQLEGDVKKQINSIAEKYLIPGETADIALMFVPSDAIFSDLHRDMTSVAEYARSKRVFLVSPNTLMVVLYSVRALLRDVRFQEETAKIRREVGLISKDCQRIDERIGKLRTHFNLANSDIDLIVTSSGKIVSRAEKMESMDEIPAAVAVPVIESD